MSRLRWPNSRHSLSDVPGTVHPFIGPKKFLDLGTQNPCLCGSDSPSISNSRSDWPKSSKRPDVGSLVERGGDERPPRDPFIGPKKFLELGTQNPCLCGSDKPLDFEQSFRLAEIFAAPRRRVLGGAWRRRATASRPLPDPRNSWIWAPRILVFVGRISPSISNSRSDWPKSSQRPDVGSLVERGGDERPPRDPFIGPKKFLDLGTQNPCLCGSDKSLDFEQPFRLAEPFAAPGRRVRGGAWRRRALATRPLHRTQEIPGFGHTRIPTFLGRISPSISNSRSDWPNSSQRPDVGSLVERGGDERPPRDPFIGPKKFLDLGTPESLP